MFENDLNYLLHKEATLKNGIDGKIVGFCKYSKDEPLMILIEYWTGEGKNSEWYKKDEYSLKD